MMKKVLYHINGLLLLVQLILYLPTAATGQEIVINAVGDIMLGGSGAAVFARHGYAYPFALTSAVLKEGDITIGNLEAPITRTGEEFRDKRFRFKSNPRTAAALKQAGFTILTLANNHIMDFGNTGLRQTLQHLAKENLLYVGAGENLDAARREVLIEVKGKTVAFLAYSMTLPAEFYAGPLSAGTAPAYPRYYREDIARAKAAADYVVVSFHWGTELAAVPNRYQITTARNAIDAGADLILGHHPHVLQGIEHYKNGIIFYSLGNFAFGSLSQKADRSVIARITLGNGRKEIELIPLNVHNGQVKYQPTVLDGKSGRRVIDRLNLISAEMGTTITTDGKRYLVNMEQTASSSDNRR